MTLDTRHASREGKLPVNLGYVYENLVAQMLVASGNKLFYHTWLKDEKHYYEVDFLLSIGAKLCPVEVKSSGYKAHASLDAFCLKYSSRIKDRFLIYTKDLAREEEILYVPAYMTPLLQKGLKCHVTKDVTKGWL